MSPAGPPAGPGSTGNLDMDPDATTRAMDSTQRPIDNWAAAWPARSSAIDTEGKAAQTGFDDTSINFRNAYNAVEAELSARVTAFAPKVLFALGGGRTIVARYVETFQQAADLLRPR